MTSQSSAEDMLLGRANAALAAIDQSAADKLYEELVTAIEEVRGKNQKEVAAELQRLARAIEAEGRLDDSMRLKQRTCEVMLRMSMAERHRGRMPVLTKTQAPSFAPSIDGCAIKRLALLYVGSQNPATDLAWLKNGLGASELRRLEENGRQYTFLTMPNSVPVLVCEDEIPGAWLPVFEVDNPDEVIEQLRSHWPDLLKEEARLPGGKLTWLRSHTRRMGLVASSCLRGLV